MLHRAGEVGEQLGAPGVGIGVEVAVEPPKSGDPCADAALGEALGAEQGIGGGRELGDLPEARLVDLLGAEGGRSLVAQALRVEALAVGQPVCGRIGPGAAPELGEEGELAVERRCEPAVDDRGRLGAPFAGNALLARPPDQRADQPRVLAAFRAEASGLLDRLVEDEGGRDHAAPRIGARRLDLEADIARERLEPGDIGLAILASLDLVLAVEEIGDVLIGAGELREDVGDGIAAEIAVGDGCDLDGPVARPEHGVEPGLLARRQSGTLDPAELRQMVDDRLIGAGAARRPGIAQPALQV